LLGAPGTDCSVNGALDAEGVDDPAAVVATTLKVYVFPFVSPGTVHVVAGAVAMQVAPPGEAVTV